MNIFCTVWGRLLGGCGVSLFIWRLRKGDYRGLCWGRHGQLLFCADCGKPIVP